MAISRVTRACRYADALRLLRLEAAELKRGEGKVGWITCVVKSVKHGQHLALGYVHRDFLAPGTKFELGLGTATVIQGVHDDRVPANPGGRPVDS